MDRRPDTRSAPNAPRGGLARSVLEGLLQEGLSVRGIAQRTGFSATAVRYWLAKHGLSTRRAARPCPGRADAQVGTVIRDCSRHGESEFIARPDGYLRCRRCRSEAVSDRRRRVKSALVEEAGGACAICGYARCAAALHFHHVDPNGKSFSLGARGMARSLQRARTEARKCVLLCANCHAEVEAGHVNYHAEGEAE
ncbi:MAG TPA: hypothetical protein VNT32_09820 [Thermoleophilaceae bacterium]|nr:hypothetical protein [Thermoleophilaceae bacterium]